MLHCHCGLLILCMRQIDTDSGNTPCEGTFLEYYACNEVHQNQEFDYNETSGLVKSHLTDSSGAALCIAACSGSASV